MNPAQRAEFGDFQTPPCLAAKVCQVVARHIPEPDAVIEPTCGVGAFLIAAAEYFPKASLSGWEINQAHLDLAAKSLELLGGTDRAQWHCLDFFACDWEQILSSLQGNLLILGNPPWVTNAAVSAMNGNNVPQKNNITGLRGMAAKTGKANFDISEWMLIRLLRALQGRTASIAMLCKTATARKFLRYAWQNDGRVADAAIYRIDAKLHFEASVDACLLVLNTGHSGPHEAAVFDDLEASDPSSFIGLAGKELVSDIQAYRKLRHMEGLCPYQWRSGIKHDCAAIMELHGIGESPPHNGLGEMVDVESGYLYPLLKCTDLAHGRYLPSRQILVTQRTVNENTAPIESAAPKTWAYLNRHLPRFEARKSSIYRGKVPFCLFGIGDYSFAPWKVAVSGLHRSARFVVIPPFEGKPVMLDDTCYFLSFSTQDEASLVADVLNSDPCREFLGALMFPDSKRSLTVEILQRLNLSVIAGEAGYGSKWQQMNHQKFSLVGAASQMELAI